jgi:hypothetical protein
VLNVLAMKRNNNSARGILICRFIVFRFFTETIRARRQPSDEADKEITKKLVS